MNKRIWAVVTADGKVQIVKTKKTFDKYKALETNIVATGVFSEESEAVAGQKAREWAQTILEGIKKENPENGQEDSSPFFPSWAKRVRQLESELVLAYKELENAQKALKEMSAKAEEREAQISFFDELNKALVEQNKELFQKLSLTCGASEKCYDTAPEQLKMERNESKYDWRVYPGPKGFDYVIYTDGACAENGRKGGGFGGWGAIIMNAEGKRKELSGGAVGTSNNCMEMQGPITTLRMIAKKGKTDINVAVVTDSQYVIRGVTEWSANWIRNGWKNSKGDDVANKEMWLTLLDLVNKTNARFYWVHGHDGDENNERCDKLAEQEAVKVAHLAGRVDITQQDFSPYALTQFAKTAQVCGPM